MRRTCAVVHGNQSVRYIQSEHAESGISGIMAFQMESCVVIALRNSKRVSLTHIASTPGKDATIRKLLSQELEWMKSGETPGADVHCLLVHRDRNSLREVAEKAHGMLAKSNLSSPLTVDRSLDMVGDIHAEVAKILRGNSKLRRVTVKEVPSPHNVYHLDDGVLTSLTSPDEFREKVELFPDSRAYLSAKVLALHNELESLLHKQPYVETVVKMVDQDSNVIDAPLVKQLLEDLDRTSTPEGLKQSLSSDAVPEAKIPELLEMIKDVKEAMRRPSAKEWMTYVMKPAKPDLESDFARLRKDPDFQELWDLTRKEIEAKSGKSAEDAEIALYLDRILEELEEDASPTVSARAPQPPAPPSVSTCSSATFKPPKERNTKKKNEKGEQPLPGFGRGWFGKM